MPKIEIAPLERTLLTIPEAAAALGVSDRTVYSLHYSGSLQTVKIGGSRRVHVDEIARFAREGAPAVTSRGPVKG